MKVITLLNEKGGVGKTTLATHIGAGLAILGMRVVLVDGDAQANTTSQMGLTEENGLYRLLVQNAEWADCLKRPDAAGWAGDCEVSGELHVLPSNEETRAIPMVVSDATLFDERVRDLGDWADVMVVDTSPTPSLLHALIYMATDYMIYPSKAERMSVTGLAKSLARLMELNNNRRLFTGKGDAELMGVVPTMYDPRTRAHDLGLSFMAGKFKRHTWSPVPVRTVWRDASWENKTLFAYAPGHEATGEAWALVGRVERGLAL